MWQTKPRFPFVTYKKKWENGLLPMVTMLMGCAPFAPNVYFFFFLFFFRKKTCTLYYSHHWIQYMLFKHVSRFYTQKKVQDTLWMFNTNHEKCNVTTSCTKRNNDRDNSSYGAHRHQISIVTRINAVCCLNHKALDCTNRPMCFTRII